MPHIPRAGRRRLLRWLVVPLAAAAAVTTVQVVQDSPGPLRAATAGAAPQVVLYSQSSGGRQYQVTSYDGPRTHPSGGTARVCGAGVSAPGGCLDHRFAMNYRTRTLTVAATETGTISGRRLSRGSDVMFRARAVTLDPPVGAQPSERVDEEVMISGTNMGFQRGTRTVAGRPESFYRLFMPRVASRPDLGTQTSVAGRYSPRWDDAVAIASDLREAYRQQRGLYRNEGLSVTTVVVGGIAALCVGISGGTLAAVAAILGTSITSSFFVNNALDAALAGGNALRRAGDRYESTFNLDIESGLD